MAPWSFLQKAAMGVCLDNNTHMKCVSCGSRQDKNLKVILSPDGHGVAAYL